VRAGLEALSARAPDIVLIHDAARPFVSDAVIRRTVFGAVESGAAIAAVPAHDTVKRADPDGMIAETLRREEIYLAQTPQAFSRAVLEDALARGRQSSGPATDEAALAEEAGHSVRLVDGESTNIKITTPHDLHVSEALLDDAERAPQAQSRTPRVGTGYDLHRLEAGKRLIIGGVDIPHDTGLAGHSDADVLCHAVTDAILGAAAAGDIGQHFPDTDPKWKGADSIELLKAAVAIVRAAGFAVSNVDAVIVAERPKLAPHIPAIRANLARAIGIDVSAIGVKGKTNEKVDALGRNEAIAVHAVALLTSQG
jgi:2-C-methyl-D-erythritol 2,4-cyclodiphosphate synthase